MSKSSRISMFLPNKMLDDFDNILNERGFRSRSSGIRNALKNYIEECESRNEIGGEYIGTIMIIYDSDSEVLEDVTPIQKEYNVCIESIMQLEVTNKQSMELIIVKGDINYIKRLSDKIMGVNEVDKVKLSTTLLKSDLKT